MIGRTSALRRLAEVTARAGAGVPAVAIVSGEAGVGKTRLLREFVARHGDGVVLAGQAEPDSLGRPFAVVDEILGTRSVDVAGALAELAERIGTGPAVIVMEDLHWADAESVAVFECLAQQAGPGIALVGTYRASDLSRRVPAGEMVLRLERGHDVETIHLDRLGRVEVAAFLAAVFGRPVPSVVAESMYQRTDGNPFFLEELVRSCVGADPEDLVDQPLPWSLEEIVHQELDGLAADDRRLAETVAILGPSASFDVLAEVAGVSEDEMVVRLRALVDRDLLVEHDDDQFRFCHALVRDAVADHLLGRQRRQLHEAALTALCADEDSNLSELARHAAGAGRFDEMVEFARRGVVFSLRGGSTHQALQLAVEALAEAPEDEVLLAAGTEAAWLLGLYDEAAGYAARWYAVAEASRSHADLIAAHRWVIRLLNDRAHTDQLWLEIADLERVLPSIPPGRDRALALVSLAQAHMLQSRLDDALTWADLAIEEATAAGADDLRVQAQIERGSTIVDLQGPDGAPALLEAIDDAERHELWVLATRGLNNLFNALPEGSPELPQLLERFQRAASRAGFDPMSGPIAELRQAEIDIAVADQAAALDRLHALDPWIPLYRWSESQWRHGLLAFVEAEREDQVAARTALAGAPGMVPTSRPILTELIVAALGGGAGVDDLLDEIGSSSTDPCRPVTAELLTAVDAAVQAGVDPDRVDAALLTVRVTGSPAVTWILGAAAGILALAGGDAAAADRLLGAALAEPVPYARRIDRARLLTLHADAQARLGRLAEARAEVAEAVALLERWPGWRLRLASDLADRLVPAAPTRIRSATELTTREREVALLVAEGRSNGDIAAELFISPKTASVHVSNILAKLGFANRTEIAAWVVQGDLATRGSG